MITEKRYFFMFHKINKYICHLKRRDA